MSEANKTFSQESSPSQEAIWSYHLDNGPFAVIEWDHGFRISRWSQKAEQLFGWKSNEVMGLHFNEFNILPKEEFERIKENIKTIEEGTDITTVLENNNCHKSGKLLHCRWHNSILRDAQGSIISIFSMVEDISALKIIQENLRKSEERFQLAVAGSKDGIWDWDIANDLAYFSPRCQEMIGEEFESHISGMEAFVKHVHPDDITSTINAYKLHLYERKEMQTEYRLRIADGSYRWFLVKGQAIWNHEGKPVRMVGSLSDIHDKKQTEEALENSENKFNTVTDHITDIVNMIDRNGIIRYTNQSVVGILGYQPEELLGTHFLTLVHPDEQLPISERFKTQVNSKGPGKLIQFRLRAKDGSYVSFEGIGNVQLHHPALQSIIMISRDITLRKRAEEIIIASEEKFRSLVHNISDIITIVSANGEIQYQSASARQIMGYEENGLRKRSIMEVVHPDDLQFVLTMFQSLIQNGGNSELIEFRLLNSDGQYFYIEAQATNQLQNPSIAGIVVTSRDISIRKKAEAEKQSLIQELTKNNADLKQFSYIVSHNLRSPLTNLISMTNLLDMDTINTERSLKLINGFKTTTTRLNETLNDLIHILLVKNNTNINIQSLVFEETLEQVTQSITALMEASGIEIESDFSGAPSVIFNQAYLESIFQNLITNSIRYRNPDRIPKVLIKTFKNQQDIHLVFSDNGIGFDMELVKDKIFGLHQKFHHHPESRGIGLYLIHAQITSLGGSISVNSQVDVGTIFSIVFKPK
jgi:PAS domain S-box-containing protein